MDMAAGIDRMNKVLTWRSKDTVLRSVSPSRRWKLPSTPSTSALSAARPASSVTPLVSGTASPASALLRKYIYIQGQA